MAEARRFLIAGNWKMHKTVDETRAFVDALNARLKSATDLPDVLICPPFTALPAARELVKSLSLNISVGAQTMDAHEEGAYTGEISPVMLRELDLGYVIIGHSERRQYFNETDDSVAEKVASALKHNLIPVICVGESEDQRDAGQTDEHIRNQVTAAIGRIDADQIARLVFAYEPIWAIGTGKTCDAIEANRVCGLIRGVLNERGQGDVVRILYGGSMKPENSLDLLKQPHIDGGLIGGASLKPDSFAEIIEHSKAARGASV